MANYNKQDYANALEVLKKCKKYFNERLNGMSKNDDFGCCKLILLDREEKHYHRGSATVYLVMDYDEFSTRRYCSDGTTWTECIYTDELPYHYAYNSNYQSTIDLATKIALNWKTIKNVAEEYIVNYIEKSQTTSSILSSFQL